MDSFLEILKSEWVVVKDAPVTFVAIIVLVWLLVSRWYKARLDSARELHELKSKQLHELQKVMGAKSPEDLSDRLNKLETELKELGETDLVAIFNGSRTISDLPDLP